MLKEFVLFDARDDNQILKMKMKSMTYPKVGGTSRDANENEEHDIPDVDLDMDYDM